MRVFSLVLVSFIVSLKLSSQNLNIHPDLIKYLDKNLAPFYHGVASGDPTIESVVIWTRVTLDKSVKEVNVAYQVSTDSLFNKIIKSGTSMTNELSDFTVKVDLDGLKAGTKYYYRFVYKGKNSLVGRTLTLPENPSNFNIAFASCSNYEWGYFNNYRHIADDKNIELVVHLGDYIYEYAVGDYGDTTIGRFNVPDHEIVSLNDYRARYSLYRLDKDLMKAHQYKPFITTWDDHETANNSYVDGAQNHQQDEGDWYTRKGYGTQAYFEWLPVRTVNSEIYRSFVLGDLLKLIILDTRITGRTEQVDSVEAENYLDSTRTILGTTQYSWLTENLELESKWKIVGNQVPIGPMISPNNKKYMDGWDGYPYERSKLLSWIKDSSENVVFVTGDYHSSFAFETDMNGTKMNEDNVAIEFVVASINSANDDEYYNQQDVEKRKLDYLKNNPNMKYCNNTDHGYLVLNIGEDEIIANFYYTKTVKARTSGVYLEKQFVVRQNISQLFDMK